MMINVLIMDREKNTIAIDLFDNEYNAIFSGKIKAENIKRHATLKELDKEIHEFIKNNNKED